MIGRQPLGDQDDRGDQHAKGARDPEEGSCCILIGHGRDPEWSGDVRVGPIEVRPGKSECRREQGIEEHDGADIEEPTTCVRF